MISFLLCFLLIYQHGEFRGSRTVSESGSQPQIAFACCSFIAIVDQRVEADTGAEFFEQARLSRSKARDEALEALNDALKDTNVSEEEQKALTTRLSTQVNNITLETKLETLIKSKGFADCVVNLEGEKANVTVMTENDALTAAEVTQIRDALMNQCAGLDAKDITIVEVK